MAWNDEPQPDLTTARLRLRPLTPADGPRVEELAGVREIADTTALIPHPYPAGSAATWIAAHPTAWRAGDGITYAVALRGDNELIGVVGLGIQRLMNSGSLGYWLGVPYWNHGYTTEAARGVLKFAFEVVGLNRIEATYLTRNPSSGRVMEKLGMTFEGIQRQAALKWGVYEDVAIRSILRSEWEATRRG